MYKILRGTLTKEWASFFYDYLCMKRQVAKVFHAVDYVSPDALADNWGGWAVDTQVPNTYSHYSDIAMETLMVKLQPYIETETKLKLNPTYSYARIYKNGDELKRHVDKISCSISTTLHLGGDEWPIFLEPSGGKGKEGTSVLLKPGDMLVYDGCNMEHWRETFEGENCGQIFLHYIETSHLGSDVYKYDKRPFLGLPALFKDFKLATIQTCDEVYK